MSRTQDAATIRSNVGTLVGWATSNTAMRADLAKNAVTLIEAGLSGLLAYTPAASDGSLDVERLARALFRGDIGCEGHGNRTRHLASDHKEDAAFIVAEYARLFESPSEGKTE